MCLLFHWSKEVGVGVELKAGIVSTEEELRGQEWKENEERSKILFSFLALILYINAEVSKSLSFWYSFFQGNLSVIILLIYDQRVWVYSVTFLLIKLPYRVWLKNAQ